MDALQLCKHAFVSWDAAEDAASAFVSQADVALAKSVGPDVANARRMTLAVYGWCLELAGIDTPEAAVANGLGHFHDAKMGGAVRVPSAMAARKPVITPAMVPMTTLVIGDRVSIADLSANDYYLPRPVSGGVPVGKVAGVYEDGRLANVALDDGRMACVYAKRCTLLPTLAPIGEKHGTPLIEPGAVSGESTAPLVDDTTGKITHAPPVSPAVSRAMATFEEALTRMKAGESPDVVRDDLRAKRLAAREADADARTRHILEHAAATASAVVHRRVVDARVAAGLVGDEVDEVRQRDLEEVAR
jgi:hypothetical protein